MPNASHKSQHTSYQHPHQLPMCSPDSTKEHNFVHLGMCGLPVEGKPEYISVVNRYHCTKCLLLVDIEDREISKQSHEAAHMGIGSDKVQ